MFEVLTVVMLGKFDCKQLFLSLLWHFELNVNGVAVYIKNKYCQCILLIRYVLVLSLYANVEVYSILIFSLYSTDKVILYNVNAANKTC